MQLNSHAKKTVAYLVKMLMNKQFINLKKKKKLNGKLHNKI